MNSDSTQSPVCLDLEWYIDGTALFKNTTNGINPALKLELDQSKKYIFIALAETHERITYIDLHVSIMPVMTIIQESVFHVPRTV